MTNQIHWHAGLATKDVQFFFSFFQFELQKRKKASLNSGRKTISGLLLLLKSQHCSPSVKLAWWKLACTCIFVLGRVLKVLETMFVLRLKSQPFFLCTVFNKFSLNYQYSHFSIYLSPFITQNPKFQNEHGLKVVTFWIEVIELFLLKCTYMRLSSRCLLLFISKSSQFNKFTIFFYDYEIRIFSESSLLVYFVVV